MPKGIYSRKLGEWRGLSLRNPVIVAGGESFTADYIEKYSSRFITTRKTVSMETGEVLEHEGYVYDGPVALACGASSDQKQIAQEQKQNFQMMSDQAQTVFGSSSKIFGDLTSAFEPILAAGPDQSGYSAQELSALRSSAITNTGNAYRNAATAAGERIAASGGGNAVLPSGTTAAIQGDIAEAGAAQTAGQLTNIDIQNAELGRQNWMNAAGVLGGATNVYNPATGSGSAATGSGSSAMSGASTVQEANRAAVGDIMGVVQAGAGMAGSILCPAKGSLYLMADDTEQSVETLRVGDLIKGIDGEPETVEEIQSAITPVLRVETEDGHVARNSRVHAFALPAGGFVVAMHSLGKIIRTALGNSKIIGVKWDGEAEVFNVITSGSHTYRADGIWALGVGEAERHVSMDRWNEIGNGLALAGSR